jgi:hypothetical protein
MLVIAFEQPWVLDRLLRMAKLNLTATTVLVFDNSRHGHGLVVRANPACLASSITT